MVFLFSFFFSPSLPHRSPPRSFLAPASAGFCRHRDAVAAAAAAKAKTRGTTGERLYTPSAATADDRFVGRCWSRARTNPRDATEDIIPGSPIKTYRHDRGFPLFDGRARCVFCFFCFYCFDLRPLMSHDFQRLRIAHNYYHHVTSVRRLSSSVYLVLSRYGVFETIARLL